MKRGTFIISCGVVLFVALVLSHSCYSFVFEDFEFWDSPHNHGWRTSDPAYPVWGFHVGYGNCYTAIDWPKGSRVMNIENAPSVFNKLEPYCIAHYGVLDTESGEAPIEPIISYEIKAPLSIERFGLVRCYLLIKTMEDEWLWLCYVPIDGDEPLDRGDFSPPIPPPSDMITGPVRCIEFPLGRGAQDSTWHTIIRDIQDDLDRAFEAELLTGPLHIKGTYGILFSGNHFSLDAISFLEDTSSYTNRCPRIWYPGIQFATLYEPFELIVYASDPEKDPLAFDIQIGGWGIHGTPTNENLSLVQLPLDPNHPLERYAAAKAALRFTPHVLENLIITIIVSDRYNKDITVFPLSVVNYHIGNHPPIIQRVGKGSTNRIAYVGEEYTYQTRALDQDGDDITYSATINGMPSYMVGPWQQSIIDPHTGLVKFVPLSEGPLRIIVTARDEKGAIAQQRRILHVYNRGTWLNHPPLKAANIRSPLIVKAGAHYTLNTAFADPDDDPLYYCTNFGSITTDGIFSFMSYFPGEYNVVIRAYDIHGAFTILRFLLDVEPGWNL
ncbi:MAG: hypothetical protein ACMUIP_08275 [bacterium]